MQRYGLYNSSLKRWNDDEFNLVLKLLFADGGVWTDTDLVITTDTGLNLSVSEGFGLVKTDSDIWDTVLKWFHNDADQLVSVLAGGSLPRYDLVCAKIDLVNKTASIVSSGTDSLMKGVEHASPVLPTTPLNYLKIGHVYVPAGATGVSGMTISNSRTVAGARAGSVSYEVNKTVTGTVNGTNAIFTTPDAYVGGTLEIHLDRQRLVNGVDFLETAPSAGTFTLTVAPVTGSVVIASYFKVVSTAGNAETVDGLNASSSPTANTLYPLNSNAKYPISVVQNAYAFRAFRSTTNQSINANTMTKVQLNGETFDPNGNFDSATNYRYTAPVSGYYQINGRYTTTTSASARNLVILMKNGSTEIARGTWSSNDLAAGAVASDLVYLTAGDYVELFAYASTANTIQAGTAETYLSGMLIAQG